MPAKKPAPDLSHIAADLQPLAVPLDQLTPDPANARTHDDKNIAAIRGSLAKYGQRRPLVVNRNGGIILKGNGTFTAAQAMGWTHLAAVWVEDDDATAAGYAIADNRTAELAAWDNDALAALLDSVDSTGEDDPLAGMFSDLGQLADELTAQATADDSADQSPPPADRPEPAERWVLINCRDEQEQIALVERFQADGREVRCGVA